MKGSGDIRSYSREELELAQVAAGRPAFRGRQIYEWLWQKGARSFEEMSNLPLALREELKNTYTFHSTVVETLQKSMDGTIKCSFRLHDGNLIEGVLIPTKRVTACVSSQVGCSLDCKFCATGFLKRERNLEAAEIFDQVWLLNELALEHYGRKLDNIVYMGMGEPLLNYRNVMRSIDLLTHPDNTNISAQRITVSTAGIVKMIKAMADTEPRFNLALSLHAATDEKRTAIMPINATNNLEMLAEAMGYWYEKTHIRPTLEYVVIENVNDREEEMKELASFAAKFPCKINLIEYNPISQASYFPTSKDNLEAFASGLEKYKLIVNVRRSRGKDIDAACGQLVNK